MRKRQILIIGNNDNGCTPELEKIAYDAVKKITWEGVYYRNDIGDKAIKLLS